MPVKPVASFRSVTVRLVSAVRLKILIAVNRANKNFNRAINRTRTRNTSLWHTIAV